MKQKIKDFALTLLLWMIRLSPVWITAIAVFVAYLIANSNLPDWLKFYLLQK